MVSPLDVPHLIELVRRNPCIWNRTLPEYHVRPFVVSTWNKICSDLNKDFGKLSEEDNETYLKLVQKKWQYVRDHWRRTAKRIQTRRKSGKGNTVPKHYLYQKQLEFLNCIDDDDCPTGQENDPGSSDKTLQMSQDENSESSLPDSSPFAYEAIFIKNEPLEPLAVNSSLSPITDELIKVEPSDPLSMDSSLPFTTVSSSPRRIESEPNATDALPKPSASPSELEPPRKLPKIDAAFSPSRSKTDFGRPATTQSPPRTSEMESSKKSDFHSSESSKKSKKTSDIEHMILEALKEEDPRILFFKGLLPYLNDFNADETFRFQTEIMRIIQDIRNDRVHKKES